MIVFGWRVSACAALAALWWWVCDRFIVDAEPEPWQAEWWRERGEEW